MSTQPAATGPTQSFSMYVSGAWVSPPFSEAASTVIASPDPVATRFVPSSGSTAMSTASTSPSASLRPTCSPMYSIGASSRSPSPMTMVPAMSVSSIVWRMASVAARSASTRSPRPMNRADAMAAASVTRTISSASSCSIESLPPASQAAWMQGAPEDGRERTPACVSARPEGATPQTGRIRGRANAGSGGGR